MAKDKALDEQLLSLPERERVRVVQILLGSLEEGPSDPDAETAWWEEVQRRVSDADSGRTKPISGVDSLKAIRERLNLG